MVVLKILWSIFKGALFVVEMIFGTMDKAGRAANKQANAWGHYDPPTRDRNSVYYDGPGARR